MIASFGISDCLRIHTEADWNFLKKIAWGGLVGGSDPVLKNYPYEKGKMALW
jgi:hypothetical protein